jgi:hypothetical protein
VCTCRLKDISEKISKHGMPSPPVLRNLVVHQVVVGQTHFAFLLQVYFSVMSFILKAELLAHSVLELA